MSFVNNYNNCNFIASYEYGLKEEHILKKSSLSNFFETAIVCLFKTFIYPGASFIKNRFINKALVEKDISQLKTIGGESIKLKTPDNDIISGMYLSSAKFKENIEKYFYVIERKNEDETIEQKLCLKSEFCLSEQNYTKPNEEAEKFINNLKNLGMYIQQYSIGPFYIELEELANVPPNNISNDNNSQRKPTAIISHGSGITFSAYKELAIAFLLRGINVMMVDFRGYGESGGSPTAHKTNIDVETAYQYLSQEKLVENKDILAYGHCLGGGPASDLAARRKGVNLFLDRSPAEFRDVAKKRFPLISSIIYAIMPWIVNYNTAENLRKVQGNIAIEMNEEDRAMKKKDHIISKKQITKLINNLPNTRPGQIIKLLDSIGGHCDLWTEHPITSLQFDKFLDQIGFRKKLF